MPSEQRLHPASVLFSLARAAKAFAVPGLLLLLSAGRTSGGRSGTFGRLPENWELWMMLLLIPSSVAAIARYLSFRIRYEGSDLVIRSGILFRSVRHVPYARIQNLDAVQNVFHRLLRVVEVRVETGGGTEPEARISVLPAAAFDEMRRRVFEGRQTDGGAVAGTAVAQAVSSRPVERTLLHLSLRELLLLGLLENKGFVVIGAAYGIAWELGVLDRLFGPMFGDGSYIREAARTGVVGAVAGGMAGAGRALAILAGGVALLLVVVRMISIAWAAVRLYGFHLTRTGDDLHARFGLVTRVATTIPLQRVQTVTIGDGPLYRLARRASVQVQTAASHEGGAGERRAEREWLAPLIRNEDLAPLSREVMPELDLDSLAWRGPHEGAFRRAARSRLAGALVLSLLFLPIAGGRAMVLVVPVLAAWALAAARLYVTHLAWAATPDVVAFRSGWLRRRTTIARVSKIQVVTSVESPFDRRTSMARVRVDTAGASSHRIDIPYLGRAAAEELHRTLACRAASTVFSTR
jgi:putative membrane protein